MRKTKVITLLSAAGVVASVGTAIYATVKATRIVRVREEEQGFDLTKTEIIKETWKCYIPPTIIATATIIGIFGNDRLNTKTQASLISAYAMAEQAYKKYRESANDIFGEDTDDKVFQNIYEKGKETLDEDDIIRVKGVKEDDPDAILLYDFWSERYFTSTWNLMDKAIYKSKARMYQKKKGLTLNDYYKFIGLKPVDGGDIIGWDDPNDFAINWDDSIIDDGLERPGLDCWTLTFNIPPHILYDPS